MLIIIKTLLKSIDTYKVWRKNAGQAKYGNGNPHIGGKKTKLEDHDKQNSRNIYVEYQVK